MVRSDCLFTPFQQNIGARDGMTQKRSAALPKLRPFAACQGTLGLIRLDFNRPSSIRTPWSQIEARKHRSFEKTLASRISADDVMSISGFSEHLGSGLVRVVDSGSGR